jgi:hypothetical protein
MIYPSHFLGKSSLIATQANGHKKGKLYVAGQTGVMTVTVRAIGFRTEAVENSFPPMPTGSGTKLEDRAPVVGSAAAGSSVQISGLVQDRTPKDPASVRSAGEGVQNLELWLDL